MNEPNIIYFSYKNALCCINTSTAELRIACGGAWREFEQYFSEQEANESIIEAAIALQKLRDGLDNKFVAIPLRPDNAIVASGNTYSQTSDGKLLIYDDGIYVASIWGLRDKRWSAEEIKPHPVEIY